MIVWPSEVSEATVSVPASSVPQLGLHEVTSLLDVSGTSSQCSRERKREPSKACCKEPVEESWLCHVGAPTFSWGPLKVQIELLPKMRPRWQPDKISQ